MSTFTFIFKKINVFPLGKRGRGKESGPYENTQPDFLISHIIALFTYYNYVLYNS